MVAYAVFTHQTTTNEAEMAIYRSLVGATLEGYPVKRLAQYGSLDRLEGPAIEGAIIFEFPSMEAARAWYDSPSYQAALIHRLSGSLFRAFLVNGWEENRAPSSLTP